MTGTTRDAVAPPPGQSPWRSLPARERPRRRQLLLAVAALFALVSVAFGFQTGRDVITAWVLLVLWAACAGDSRRWRQVVVRDWLPLIAVLFAYDLLRGLVDSTAGRLGGLTALADGRGGTVHAHVLPQLRADERVFGGITPTVWLQQRLFDPAHVHWYDVLAAPVYMSHFVVSLALAVVIWATSYELFRRYVWTLVVLTAITLVTYAVFPAAPPWMASLNGYLPPGVLRVTPYTLQQTGVGTVHSALERGEAYANAVAAVPSLHGAVPMMLLLFAWPVVRPRTRALLGLYVLAMLFTLVYGGEHYVSDVLLGWAYAAVSVLTVRRVLDRRSVGRGTRQPG